MLFESLCTVNVSSLNLKENKKFRNPVHIIFVLPVRLVGLSSCRTSDRNLSKFLHPFVVGDLIEWDVTQTDKQKTVNEMVFLGNFYMIAF